MLVAAGVDPQMVEWFGRWRSESVRSYTEDARALAPQAARLAGAVAGEYAGGVPRTPGLAGGCAGGVPRTPGWAGIGGGAPSTPALWPQSGGQAGSSSLASGAAPASPIASQKWVEQRLAAAEGETATYQLRLASNKLHIALRRILELEPRAWFTLCGWRFGLAPAGSVRRLRSGVADSASACDNCKRAANRAQIPVDGMFAEDYEARARAAPLAPLPSASSSSNSSSDSVA